MITEKRAVAEAVGRDSLMVVLCIPTLNPGKDAVALLDSIARQTFQPDHFLVMDSCSDDGSVALFESAGAQVVMIARADFNHGATRQMAVSAWPQADVMIFLTQDAILAGSSDFANLLSCFEDEKVGAAYGRQLPRQNAGAIESHARLYNYSARSRVNRLADVPETGIKTAFLSNSFAAYRCAALTAVGGFPGDVILGEDTYVAARMLMQGWKTAYCAEARVFHSHDYSLWQEFSRYFDIGVFHGREPWLRREFNQPEGEGLRFVRSELAFLLRTSPLLVFSAFLRNLSKFIGFKLGTWERHLPLWLKQRLSFNGAYWERQRGHGSKQ